MDVHRVILTVADADPSFIRTISTTLALISTYSVSELTHSISIACGRRHNLHSATTIILQLFHEPGRMLLPSTSLEV